MALPAICTRRIRNAFELLVRYLLFFRLKLLQPTLARVKLSRILTCLLAFFLVYFLRLQPLSLFASLSRTSEKFNFYCSRESTRWNVAGAQSKIQIGDQRLRFRDRPLLTGRRSALTVQLTKDFRAREIFIDEIAIVPHISDDWHCDIL